MSSVSYANAAAGTLNNGSNVSLNGSSPESVKENFKNDQTTTTEEVDDSSATTEEDIKDDDKAKSSSTPKQSKKEKAKLNLAPAPVPTVSAWAKSSNSKPAASSAAPQDKSWPTPQVSVLSEVVTNQQKPKPSIPTVKSTGKEKWVPFQASVVMSGPKTGKGNNQGNGANQKKPNKGKKNTRQQDGKPNRRTNQKATKNGDASGESKQQDEKSEPTARKQGTPKADAVPSAVQPLPAAKAAKTTESSESKGIEEDSSLASSEAGEVPADSQEENSQTPQDEQAQHDSADQRPQYNGHQHSRQYSNGGTRRYSNRPQNGFVPFNRNLNFIPTTYLPNGQVFQPRGFNQGFMPHQSPQHIDNFRRYNNGFPPPQNFMPMPPMNQGMPPVPQVVMQDPITSLALQVDYYFSIQNLVKDIFLRRHMDSEGYIPLKVIANFYRVQHLSGGDLALVADCLDSCSNLEYVGDKDTFDIKIRARENPLNWVLPEDQRQAK